MPESNSKETTKTAPPLEKTTRVEVIKPDKDDPQSLYEPDGDTFTTELDNILDMLGKGLDVDSLKKEVRGPDRPAPKKAKKPPVFKMDRLAGKIFEATHSDFKPQEFLTALIDHIHALHPLDIALILTGISDKSDYMRLESLVHREQKAVSGNRVYPIKDSVLAEMAQLKIPAVLQLKESHHGKFEKEVFDKLGMRACLFIPVLNDDRRPAVLVLAGRKSDQFTTTESNLEWVSSALSLALERGRLAVEHEKQRLTLELIKQMNRMAVSTTLEIEKIFKFTMDRIRTIFDVEAGLLYLKEKEKLKTAITFNTQKESIQQFRQKIGSRIAGIVVSKGKPLIVNDTQKTSLPSANTTQQKVLNTRAILCVPLITQAKALGAIELISRANVGFNAVDDTLLNSIAAALSPTLLLRKR